MSLPGQGNWIVRVRTAAVALLALGVSAGAHAQIASVPEPGPGDPRIKQFMYDPDAIVAVRAALGYEMAIEFDESERIENVSIGDSLSWQVTPNRKATLLFLKPMSKGAATSMTVVTTQRIYSFLLTAVDGKGSNDPSAMLRLRFLYPQPPAPLASAPAAPPPPPKPEDFNFDYKVSGAKAVAPVRVFDDGKATYFQFDPKKDTPAIFTLNADSKEEMGNTRISGPYTVLDMTAEKFILRYGKTKTDIRNNAWGRSAPPVAAPLPQPKGG